VTAAAVALALAAAADLARPASADARRMHENVGGLGTGGSLDFSGCAEDFDARLGGPCEDRLGAPPASGSPCRRHAAVGAWAR